MINANLITSFGTVTFDFSYRESGENEPAKVESKDPDEHQIIEGFEGDCEQCEQERIKKPCTICED